MVPFVDDMNLIAAFESVFNGGLAGMPVPAGERERAGRKMSSLITSTSSRL